MLDIRTFDAQRGGNVLYKALAHPLAAEALSRLGAGIEGRLAVYDPDGAASMLYALHPALPRPAELYVHDVEQVGVARLGCETRAVVELGVSQANTVLVAAFDSGRIAARLAGLLPQGMRLVTLDEARLPDGMLTSRRSYLDRLNFATNFAFFRDADGLSSRLVTANYWSDYGASSVRLWLRLFDGAGEALASWEQEVAPGAAGIVIDSREVRQRFGLGPFAGQLFVHAIGVAGHDVVKYALDTYGHDGEPSLSVTHDANAWPSDRYAGLPAPRPDETVMLWVQNSHAAPIPPGAITLDRMGAEQPVAIGTEIAPFASVQVDVAALLPGLAWPAQIEVRSGRHVVRPRYEVVRAGRTRIAHMNVERADLRPEPAIGTLPASLGRGFVLPFPVLDPTIYRSIVLPTPMAETQADLPLRVDVFDREGQLVAQRFLGRLARSHACALDLAELRAPAGHAELVYDFRDGGGADGWMHALVRYERHAGVPHAAETSFGAHIFNTLMTWRDEPQSYSGPPPGLSTRLFLKLGHESTRSFCVLIYPASAPWREQSQTTLILHDAAGTVIGEAALAIACSGSALVEPEVIFGARRIAEAGVGGYVLIRDTTCRLFGYHGLSDASGAFSLDHMFGF
ncbi:hypothetical protein FHR90_002287 [Endobacter medicaginis]|uniref:Uncharacterized protein n=1 Tax=Endobacter medicaginis TaxID=1181271 RepID=A0A839UXF1_9PROT|nr:hypothetical protein [Endobacter medicaginis]MBB3174446.1 hypothetical protein [Endobacter medicaginis]MCX5475104.1 hypothetical protein [Endobacter medicaginis]NVN29524.1 hypothetical protein [Endobacter medicaginis]